jgi:protein TonB
MSNVSIYGKNWIDLVFEDKNKAYGAYQLRQENSRTTLIAFFSSIALIASLIGGWMIFSSFNTVPAVEIIKCPIGPTITPVDLEPLPQVVKPKVEPIQQASSAVSENKFKKYVADRNPDTETEVIKNSDIAPQTTATGGENDNGTGIETPTLSGGTPGGTAIVPKIDGPITTNELDRLPKYPGGMEKFYQYVGNTIDKEKIESSSLTMNVIMAFVIERDGSMTDIKVVRSSDKNLEKEAIRVLKKLKVKWEPGIKDGEKVRTQYLLPIKVAL